MGTPEKDTAFGIQKVTYADKNVFTCDNERLTRARVYPHNHNTPQRNFVALLLFSPQYFSQPQLPTYRELCFHCPLGKSLSTTNFFFFLWGTMIRQLMSVNSHKPRWQIRVRDHDGWLTAALLGVRRQVTEHLFVEEDGVGGYSKHTATRLTLIWLWL